MKLDLEKIASARSKILAETGPMDYLLSRIRRELEERVVCNKPGFNDILVIDFENGDLELGNVESTKSCSLLEAGSAGDLSGYAERSLDCVVANLQLSWLDFQQFIPEIMGILRPGGSLYFSALGPDSLREIYESWAKVDDLPHVHTFVDMHHLGDTLLKTGFVQPIVDADWIFVDYPDVDVLMADLKTEGFTNILSQRRKTLTGAQRFREFKNELGNVAKNDDNVLITFEVIYGYAKVPDRSDGTIRIQPPEMNKL